MLRRRAHPTHGQLRLRRGAEGEADMDIKIVTSDLLDQPVEAIVNPWNPNVVPWWLLAPHGVSGAIKKRAGTAPFRELARVGRLPPGGAVATSAGKLPYKAIIHVASINLWGRSSERVIQLAVEHALHVAEHIEVGSVAFPLLGTGSGGVSAEVAEAVMQRVLHHCQRTLPVLIVRYP